MTLQPNPLAVVLASDTDAGSCPGFFTSGLAPYNGLGHQVCPNL